MRRMSKSGDTGRKTFVTQLLAQQKREDRSPSNSSRKSLNTGNKIYKSRIPTTQVGRSTVQGDLMSHSVASRQTPEEPSVGISSNNSARRPTMKALNVPSSTRKSSTVISADKRQLEIQYGTRKIRYANLKKALADKQKATQSLYEEMSSLREKIIAAGGKDPGKIEESKSPRLEHCPKQSPPSETSPAHDCSGQREQVCMDESVVIGITLLQNQLQDLFDRSQEFCQRALDKNTTLTDLVKCWLTCGNQDETGNASVPVDSDLKAQLPILERDNEDLRTRLDKLRMAQDDIVAEFAKRSSTLCNEYENYRGRIKEGPNVDQADVQNQLSIALEELKVERDKANQGKERTKMMELQMQKARTKIRELQGHVANEETKSQQLQNSMKSLEAQLKQKDQTTEVRIRDMHKAMKNSEVLVAKMEKQRDTFESRLLELKEKMASKEVEASATIKDLSERCETIDAEINEERKNRQQAESTLAQTEERYKQLEEKSQLLCDLANEKSNNLAVADDNHTENEVRLYNDLKVAQAELMKQKEKIEQLDREKQEIIAVMHQAARLDNEDETRNKLAVELVAKTNDLQNLMLEHAQLQRVTRFAHERNEVLENKLAEIQHNLHARSKEGDKTGVDFHAIELQQQISDLRNSLAQVVQQNQELEITLTQKQLELEQRDRVIREQSKFLKVRDELLSLLRGKQQANADNPSNGNDEDIDKINRQIAAKTEAIQELYATLEGKQMQVMRLEKLVKLLEDQQDRAQAQRTRLEHRIAQLEVSLREKNKTGNRSRGFGIL